MTMMGQETFNALDFDPNGAAEPIIVARDLRKTYTSKKGGTISGSPRMRGAKRAHERGEKKAVDGLDLTIFQGECSQS